MSIDEFLELLNLCSSEYHWTFKHAFFPKGIFGLGYDPFMDRGELYNSIRRHYTWQNPIFAVALNWNGKDWIEEVRRISGWEYLRNPNLQIGLAMELNENDLLKLRNTSVSAVNLNPSVTGSVFPITIASVNIECLKALP